jgi:hypothetical protein
MKWKNIIWLTWILILISKPAINAQSYQMDSVLQLERNVMLSVSTSEKNESLWQKYHFYKNHEAFEEALSTLNRLSVGPNDSLTQCNYYFQKAVIQSALGYFSAAMVNVNEYCAICRTLDDDKQSLRLLILIENEDWSGFNKLIMEDSLRVKLSRPELIDAKKYVRSSSYLPGLGLMRLGYYRKGFSSLGLCVGALGFTTYNIMTGYYVTSLLSGFDPFLKFYKGGRRLTEATVEQENIKKANLVKQVGYQYIQKRYF